MTTFDFEGKTVIVTGSTRGIGRRIAECFYSAGANTVFCGRSESAGQELIRQVADGDESRILYCTLDVSDLESIAGVFEAAIQKFGQLDILVNNAGIWSKGDVFEVTEEQWDAVLDTDLKAVFFASQYFCKHQRVAGRGGAIVNISSINAIRVRGNCAAYNVAKAGVKSVTECFALEAGPYGIRCNAVGPGSVPTDLNKAFYEKAGAEEAYNATVPLGRRGKQEEIADAVMFLASDKASYLTGQTIYAEGGWLLH